MNNEKDKKRLRSKKQISGCYVVRYTRYEKYYYS